MEPDTAPISVRAGGRPGPRKEDAPMDRDWNGSTCGAFLGQDEKAAQGLMAQGGENG